MQAIPARLDRRLLLARGLALAVGAVPGMSALEACGGSDRMPDRSMPDWMMGEEMDPQMMRDMRVIRDLFDGHTQIRRRVEDVDGGIRSWTTSADAELARQLRTHVTQMNARLDRGNPIREMDPLFREIFEHRREIEMTAQEITDGVLVVETSTDPQVELLIRQHAHRAVSEFVADGMARAMRPTPLPTGYDAA